MTEVADPAQTAKPLTFEPLSYLANDSTKTDSDESRRFETQDSALADPTTDQSKATTEQDNENSNNAHDLNSSSASAQVKKPEHTTTNGIHSESEFDDEEIQKKMSTVIQDIRSASGDDMNTSRKSVTSNHLHDTEVRNSVPHIDGSHTEMDPTSKDSNESASGDHHASTEQHPSNQETSENNLSDDNSAETKTETVHHEERPSSAVKENNLDETTPFHAPSPKQPSSRIHSAASKQSVHGVLEETPTSGDEKRTDTTPSKLPADPDNDTDADNREVETVERRPSLASSPLKRPRSPTPNDSRKASISIEPSSSENNILSNAATVSNNDKDENEQEQHVQASTGSRRESANKPVEKELSRPASALKAKVDDDSDERLQLIRPGEKIQVPTNDVDSEGIRSPPPTPLGIQSMAAVNPLLENHFASKEQEHSRPPSAIHRRSPTESISNDKGIEGDAQSPSNITGHDIHEPQTHVADNTTGSRRASDVVEQPANISSSRPESTAEKHDEPESHQEPQIGSRRTSNIVQPELTHDDGSVSEQHVSSSRRESTHDEPKPPSRQGSATPAQPVPSKRTSVASQQLVVSRRESTGDEPPKPPSRKPSVTFEETEANKRPSVASEHHTDTGRESTTDEPHIPSKRLSTAHEQKPPSRKASTSSEHETINKRESIAQNQLVSSRQGSAQEKQQLSSKRGSYASDHEGTGHQNSTTNEVHLSSKRGSTVSDKKLPSRKGSTSSEQEASARTNNISLDKPSSSRQGSDTEGQKSFNRQTSSAFQQQPIKPRDSVSSEAEKFTPRNSHFSERKSSSNSITQKSNFIGQEKTSRRASEQEEPAPSSRRTSTNKDKQVSSSRHSSVDNTSSFQQPSHRDSLTKQEYQPTNPLFYQRQISSSSETDAQNRTSANFKKERKPSAEKQKSSSSTEDNNQVRSTAIRRRSSQKSKENSNIVTEETVLTPLIMDSSKARQHSAHRNLQTDSENEYASKEKFPPLNSSFHQRTNHAEILNQQKAPLSNRSETQQVSSSRSSATTQNAQRPHWTNQIPVPSIHLSDDDVPTSADQGPRPRSPSVGQIAERNKPATPPPPPPITTAAAKKRVATDAHKRKPAHVSRRTSSAESANQIRMVDDNSLDSTSENNSDFEPQRRRHIKPKKKDVETNTEVMFDVEPHKQQRSFFDERELTPQKPLKATKPMSDHYHSIHRRASNKEQTVTTSDTISNAETPTVRRTVKVSKDRNQDQEPVNVNVTVVVKKFAGTNDDGTSRTVTEAYVEPKSEQYFEHVQRSTEVLPPPSTTEDNEKSEELKERPKSTDQAVVQPTEPIIPSNERQIQSDTEQFTTEKQKKNRRPKRISRTCQTYESVFRRMEREQQQELRATSDTEKNVQTIKSQLRPRRKSPKKNMPLYLSADSFRVEELLPKSFHQSRKTMSKSSALARSLSPHGGKLLILRPTLPFHHSDAVNVQRVCLQYAIDLIPNESASHISMSANRGRVNAFSNNEQTNSLPMIGPSTSGPNITSNKSAKSASNRSEEYSHRRKNGGGV